MDKDTLYEIGADLISNIFDCIHAMENKYGKHDLLLIQVFSSILATKIVKSFELNPTEGPRLTSEIIRVLTEIINREVSLPTNKEINSD